ncbi:hypothetical protein EYC84_002552 [Monilinia fructicola]|uniref:Uncharacterized protein n=1 Tax=Monilinia fructicola TaxID=38448 RepID=A0A5M9JQE0_MONFR|nr:hypothetical protein EYC84_002552 [Monilinia fructicola]
MSHIAYRISPTTSSPYLTPPVIKSTISKLRCTKENKASSILIGKNTIWMPTPLGDTIPSINPHSTSDTSRHTHLPIHHDSDFPYTQELDDLSTTATSRHRNTSSKAQSHSISYESTQAEDSKHLLGDQDSADEEDEEGFESDSMGPRSRKGKAPGPIGSSSATGGEDSHLQNGSMNGNVEYRRKHANLDSSGATANLISRESFTLDDPVPKTPTINNHGFSELPLQDKRNFLLLVLFVFLARCSHGSCGRFGTLLTQTPYVVQRSRSFQLGDISIFIKAVMESNRRCDLESQSRKKKELDHANPDVIRIWE